MFNIYSCNVLDDFQNIARIAVQYHKFLKAHIHLRCRFSSISKNHTFKILEVEMQGFQRPWVKMRCSCGGGRGGWRGWIYRRRPVGDAIGRGTLPALASAPVEASPQAASLAANGLLRASPVTLQRPEDEQPWKRRENSNQLIPLKAAFLKTLI